MTHGRDHRARQARRLRPLLGAVVFVLALFLIAAQPAAADVCVSSASGRHLRRVVEATNRPHVSRGTR